ncbi:hypothetical protein ACJMK2_042894 [Sinanodonta woodiana]|uniref:mitogen-activated protein kinase kinase n=1 Tax=Sinanodonta woodiana TaxID=1069815 RepID=A0ABD3VWX4_SINWO
MNSPPPFTLRIRTEQEQDFDWMVQPDEITFHQALPSSFLDDDEDGERITVRSDDELKAMFEMYYEMLSEDDVARGLLPPFIIYPRVGKTPNMRNKYGLTIKTPKSASDTLVKTQSSLKSQAQLREASLKPQAQLSEATAYNQGGAGAGGDIKEILACGQITETDLQILQLLGSGNGGKVYRAIHIPSQQQMAVKVTELGVAVDVQKQIISELEILYKCQSPAIITFYGAYFKENRISMCTEFMDGGSLDKYGQVPETVLGRMAVFIVQGLLYMWNLKILHRDIKPSNILVSTRGEVKLCDFGVSAQLIKSIAETYVGTNAYMSPERIRADAYGISSDVWSLGVSLFEFPFPPGKIALATGHFPFKLVSMLIMLYYHKPIEILHEINISILSSTCRYLSVDATKTLVCLLVLSKLDYCN